MLQITNITKTYRTPAGLIRPVAEFSLHVGAGEFVAVQGPSGCGKSTLLLAAGGLLRPDSGVVSVAGQDVYALSADARAAFRARHIGFVFQQFHLVPYLSVLDNILMPSMAGPIADPRARARQLIEQFGLSERADHPAAHLSTGERQRTALARAMLADPELILADEPTGNLDEGNGQIVLDYLDAFAKGGRAVLLVTHDPRAAARAGRIVPMGRPAQVCAAASE